MNSHQDNWDDFAAYVAHAYNSTIHATTGCSPNMLVFGSEIIMPADIVFGTVSRGVESPMHGGICGNTASGTAGEL